MKGDLPYLKHIFDAMTRIESYVNNMRHEKFLADAKTQSAVVRELEVVGGATKKLSENIKKRHGGVPWAEVAGMRDRLIHAYFDVDLEEVWKTVMKDLPQLRNTVKKAIAELERSSR